MSARRFASIVALAAALLVTAPHTRPAYAGRSKALKCAFAKQQAALAEADALLACKRKALRANTAVDPDCTAAAVAGFEDAFQQIETRGGCAPTGDADVVGRIIDRCAQQLGFELQGACSASGQPCGATDPPCCAGLVCRAILGEQAFCGG